METYTIHRRIGEEEIASILRLAKIIERHDGHKALEDHTWIDLVQGGRRGVSGFIAESVATSAALGYVRVAGTGTSWAIELLVDPDYRTDESALGLDLLRQALEEISRSGGGHVHLWVAKPTDYTDAIAQAAGLHKGRDLYQMRRALPLTQRIASRPVITRGFVVGRDEEAWLEVNNRAFAWHPEQGGWSRATLLSRESEPWFDPAGFLLTHIDGRLAAFCWTKIHAHEEPPLGEIYVIGTEPDFAGQGLGAAMCEAGLDYLSQRGLTTAMLYVDADNKTALTMYDHFGFHIDHIDRAYTADR
jgi:mycothiol synthase